MNWKLCITDPQMHALDFCGGSMDEGNGCGYGYGYADVDGDCDGIVDDNGIGGSSSGYGDGYDYGDGYGDGGSRPEWK